MRLVSMVAIVLALTGSASAAEDAALGAFLQDQLKCFHNPDPTTAAYSLAGSKRIKLDSPVIRVDGESCFKVRPELTLGAMSFGVICVANSDPLAIRTFPKLFWAPPGTQPGISLSVETTASKADVTSWARTYFQFGTKSLIDSGNLDGMTSIRCDDFLAAPP